MPKLLRFFFMSLAGAGALLFPTSASAEHGTADEASPNMFHVANRGNIQGTTHSDFAFWQGGAVRNSRAKGGVIPGAQHDLLFQGHYNGFRIWDIHDPEDPVLVTDFRCRANQGDVSVYQARDRLLLIQSVDRPVTTDNCETAVDTPIAVGAIHPITGLPFTGAEPGFEGLRIFDVTVPERPVHIASAPTACGSHTHTTIPDKDEQRAVIYVSSYPLGTGVTGANFDFGGPRCTPPHQKISIVEIYDRDPADPVVREQPLHPDTLPFLGSLEEGGTGAQGCHDIGALYEASQHPEQHTTSFKPGRSQFQVAAAACLSEGQLWDISDPAHPTTLTTHSHIRNPFINRANPVFTGLFHTGAWTWDGEVILFWDEWQGGGGHGCDGPQDDRGNIWFYKAVPPGTEPVPVLGRYQIPRPQPQTEACTMHQGNVIPVTNQSDGYLGVSAGYESGTTVFDFTGVEDLPPQNIENLPFPGVQPTPPEDQPVPLAGREVAFFDAKGDGRGFDDAWSSYWFNDYIWVNTGLGPRHHHPNRGLDVYKLLGERGRLVDENRQPTVTEENADDPTVQQFRARKFRYENPQTQEVFQSLGQ